MKTRNRGQMRIVEAMLACVILVIGIVATSYFSVFYAIEEGGELEETGRGVMAVLSNADLIKCIIQNETNSYSKMRSLIAGLLPPEVFYNLTLVSGLTGQPITCVSNIEQQSSYSNLTAVSLQQMVSVSLPLTRVEGRKLDVMLIMDRSGSMSQENKIYYAKKAATTFIDQLNMSKDLVGLVSFSTSANLDCGLTTDSQAVKTKINNLWANGWTNMGDAVKASNSEFLAHNRTDVLHVMIVLTDGVANRPCTHIPQHDDETCPDARQYALDESDVAQSRGVLIYTIGLGSDKTDFDEVLLRDMQTNGYYYAPSGEELESIYLMIAQDLLFAVKYDIVIVKLTLLKA